MNLFLARLFSTILHPILIPIYSILIVLFLFPYRYINIVDKTWNLTIGIIIAMTTAIPAILVFIIKKLKIIDDFDISIQKQRILPYLIFFFFYLMTYMTVKPKINSSPVFLEDKLIATIMLGATISLGLAFFLNNFIKVSVHTMGVTNLFMLSLFLSSHSPQRPFLLLIGTFILIGFVGSSRIFLNAHKPKEVYYGIFCGVIGQLLAFSLYLT